MVLGLATQLLAFHSNAAQLICNGIYSSVGSASDQKIKLIEELKLEKSQTSYTSAISKVITSDSKFEIQAYASMDAKGTYTIGIDITENKTNIMHAVIADNGKVSLFINSHELRSPFRT